VKTVELSKEKRQDLMTDIKSFFWSERGEHISDFQASIFLEFVLQNVAPHIYNQAIADAYKLMSEKIEDLYGLEKRSR
jgi:uncharacterized protein (DUF2164 family)